MRLWWVQFAAHHVRPASLASDVLGEDNPLAKRKPHQTVQGYNRCFVCGRPRGYMRRFGLCRICFRERALLGELPGVTKSSW